MWSLEDTGEYFPFLFALAIEHSVHPPNSYPDDHRCAYLVDTIVIDKNRAEVLGRYFASVSYLPTSLPTTTHTTCS